MALSDQELLLSLQAGNQSAFEMVFRNFYQSLCRYAYSFLSDKDEAEEIVQSTFIQVWEKRSSIEIQTSLRSYLYRMVRNACLNVIKHEKVKQIHVSHEMKVVEKERALVDEVVHSNELELKISEAMKLLPEQCRLVFQLSRFEDLKYAEIADQLQISVKTVENQIGKALKIMRENLKEYLPVLVLFFDFNWWI
jgi:RNA polymerase sigma-70 factor (ECF subfamily)